MLLLTDITVHYKETYDIVNWYDVRVHYKGKYAIVNWYNSSLKEIVCYC